MQGTPPRLGRIFALSVAAACALTVASVGEVAGQVLPKLPALPQIQLPSVPKAPALQPPSQLQLPETPQLPSVPPPPVQAPTPSLPGPRSTPDVPAGGAPPASSGGARTSAGGSTPQAPGSRAGASRADDRDTKSRRAAARKRNASSSRERRFRRTVKGLWACSYAVSGFERSVLIRRAGLDGYSPVSSVVIAQQLRVSVRRIRRAQRSGVRDLRAANRSDGCAMNSPSAEVQETVGALRAVATAPALVTDARVAVADAQASPASKNEGKGEVLAERRTSTDVHLQRPQIAGTLSLAAGGDDGSEPWPLILILSLMAIAASTPLLLRRRKHSYPVAPAEPEVPAWVEPEPPETPAPSQVLAPPPWAEPEQAAPKRRARRRR